MNDWWNDPPEEPDAPECPSCHEGYGDYVRDARPHLTKPQHTKPQHTTQIFQCDQCGFHWIIEVPDDPGPEDYIGPKDIEEDYPRLPHCPHGNDWGECSACDHAGDLAYDAARENRAFGRR